MTFCVSPHRSGPAQQVLRSPSSRLGAYPRQNGLALALREIGRIERTLFMLDWFELPGLRRPATVELNKNEARNALARAVCFHGLGRLRDRAAEAQQYRQAGSRSSPPQSRSGTTCISVIRSTNCAAPAKSSRIRCSPTSPQSAGSTPISPATICGIQPAILVPTAFGRFARQQEAFTRLSLPERVPDLVLLRSCPSYYVRLCGYVFIGMLADASASTLDDQRRSTSLDSTWNGGAPTLVLTVRFGHILRRINRFASQAILTVGGRALGVCPITAPEFSREPGLVCGSSLKLRGFGGARQFTPAAARGESQ